MITGHHCQDLGATSKKVVVLGGAHHKAPLTPTPRHLLRDFIFSYGKIIDYFQNWKRFQSSLQNYRVFVQKVSLTAYLWQLLNRDRTQKLKSSFVLLHDLEASGSNGCKNINCPLMDIEIYSLGLCKYSGKLIRTGGKIYYSLNHWIGMVFFNWKSNPLCLSICQSFDRLEGWSVCQNFL